MNKRKISASLMCADPYEIKKDLKALEAEKVDYLHIDIMDGHFVSNMGISPDWIRMVRKHTNIPIDFHLMVENPNKIISLLELKKGDIVSIHFESTYWLEDTINLLKKYKSYLFIAFNPSTPICILDQISPYIDGINFMTITPGFAGQKMLSSSIEKAKKLVNYLKIKNLEHLILEVDGNMNFENAKIFKDLGANIFVAGTSSIFPKNKLNSKNLKEYRNILNE